MGLVVRYCLFAFVIALQFNCEGQNDIKVGGSIERQNAFTNTLYSIGLHADSLNFLREDQELPKFLADTLIDWKRYRREGLHLNGYYFSYRKEVLDRVVNVVTLKRIMESKDRRYDYLYSPEKLIIERRKIEGEKLWLHDYVNLPYQELTLRQLAGQRLSYVNKVWYRKN